MTRFVRTVCPYCGVGCSFDLFVQKEKVMSVKPWKGDPVSEGKPCIKGLKSYQAMYAKDRFKQPMIRKRGRLVKSSWEEAYNLIYENFRKLKPSELAFYASSPAANEACYLVQKIARDIFETDNVDSSARLCHATTEYALNKTFGNSSMTAKLEDLEKADCILIVGSNPKVTYPVAFNKMLNAKKKGAKIICLRDWKDETSRLADVYVEIEPGLEIVFMNAVLNILIRNGEVKIPPETTKAVSEYHADSVAEICSTYDNCLFTLEDIETVARLIGKSKKFVLMHGMGITQHKHGTDNVFAALNLVLAKKGKSIPMRGKANIQGVSDMGCQPQSGGKTLTDSVFTDTVKAMYVMHSNPAQSLPDLNKAHQKLKDVFLVLHATYPNSTLDFADVVLPAASWAETTGTFTSAESRVRMINQAIPPLYDSREDWAIIDGLARRFGKNYKYKTSEDVLKEIKKKVSAYHNIDISLLKRRDAFDYAQKSVKFRKYHPVRFEEFEETRSREYPFILTTWRWANQFCTGDMSRRSPTLEKMSPEPLCYISLEDATKHKLKDGKKIIITSKAGEVVIKVKIMDEVPKGLLVAPFHFSEFLVNKLIPLNYGTVVDEPNLKRVAVKIKKKGFFF